MAERSLSQKWQSQITRWRSRLDRANRTEAFVTGFATATLGVGVIALAARRSAIANARQLSQAAKRLQADADTARRFAKRDAESAKQFAIQKFAKSMIEISDSLALARTANADRDALLQGLAVVDRQLESALLAHGVVSFGEPGDLFDPSRHEAIETTATHKSDLVVARVYQRGYLLHDRLLRAARVATSEPSLDHAPTTEPLKQDSA